MSFKDHFSSQATEYAKFRPQYPRALFEFIARMSPNDDLALDVATGNGQAALALADFFKRVIALDASKKQIASAQPNDRVTYGVAPAEATRLPEHSCDALTVAQALHWFDLEAFYKEARRVLRPGGLLVVWSYNELRITPDVDKLVRHYHDEVVGPYWPPERQLVGRPYLALAFPFDEIATPDFQIEVSWSLAHLLGYLRTWSSTQRFLRKKGRDPVDLIEKDLLVAWGDSVEARRATWPLTIRVGRV